MANNGDRMQKLDPPHEDQHITLVEACEIVFGGRCGVATLRSEARNGRLEIYKIGRRYYTTLKAVRQMVNQARLSPGEITPPAAESARPVIPPLSSPQNVDEAETALHKVWSNLNPSSGH